MNSSSGQLVDHLRPSSVVVENVHDDMRSCESRSIKIGVAVRTKGPAPMKKKKEKTEKMTDSGKDDKKCSNDSFHKAYSGIVKIS